MEGEDLVCNFKKCRKRLNSVAYVSVIITYCTDFYIF